MRTKPYDKISRSHAALGVEHGDQLHQVLFVCLSQDDDYWKLCTEYEFFLLAAKDLDC